MVQCEFLGEKFEVSLKKINAIKNIEITTEIEYNEAETLGGLPTVEIKGYKPQSFSISYTAATSAGLNPYKEYKKWKKKLGESGFFYAGKNQIGLAEFVLMGVTMSNAKVTPSGLFYIGEIELQLEQDILKKGA